MMSPFPGMDPYIESCGLWEDFHPALIAEIKQALARAAPERYVVRFGERSYVVLVDDEGKRSRPFLPDVKISSTSEPAPGSGTAVAEPALETQPVLMRRFIQEEYRESFVEILETGPEERLVTCIEVLSPSNKRPDSPGWDLYQRKRQAVLLGHVNLVEIDFLRRGQRMPMVDPWPASPYTLLVSRAGPILSCKVWPAHFRVAVPSISVPLAKPDPDLTLNLQPMIQAIYGGSRYHRSIDYTKPLAPPLSAEDSAWFEQQLQVRG